METSNGTGVASNSHTVSDSSDRFPEEGNAGRATHPAFGLEIEQEENQTVNNGLEIHNHESSKNRSSPLEQDEQVQQALHNQFIFDDIAPSKLETAGQPATSRATGSRVLITRVLKSDDPSLSALRRTITLLATASDPSIPQLHSTLESTTCLYTITSHHPFPTLRTFISTHGPQSGDSIKSLTTQLFSGIAVIFLAGFAHLRICDETILISDEGQLVISDFQYAFPYGKEKLEGGLYAAVDEKFGEDVYVAPEVFREIRYNARKAVIWSCGVLLYYIATGTTAPLSILKHPSFDPPAPTSTTQQPPNPQTTTNNSPSPLNLQQPPSSSTSPSSHRRSSLQNPLLPLPSTTSRLSLPTYLRNILPKMLSPLPHKRPELIEVAAKVPKMIATKETRGLMEVAWGDYKWNVGPMAGLRPGEEEEEGGERGSVFSWSGRSGRVGSLFGAGSGISVGSGWSAGASLRGLLPGGGGGGRRKSHWV